MITKEIKLYEYGELSDKAKENVRQWFMDDPDRGILLSDDFKHSFIEYFFPRSKLEVQWSLNYCQGDGVNIYGELDMYDMLAYITKWNPEEHSYFKHALDPRDTLTDKEFERLCYYRERSGQNIELDYNNRYCYCVSKRTDFATDMIADLEYLRVRDIDRQLIVRFQEAIVIPVIENLCDEMADYGYRFLYEISDEEIEDTCNANGWYFTDTGKFEVA